MRQRVHVMQLISSLEVGGAEKLLVALMDASKQDESVQYVVVVMNNAVNPVLRKNLGDTGFPVYYLNRPEGHWHPKYLHQLLQIIDRYNIQVVHAHNQGSKFWAILCRLAQPSLKLVMTIHNTVVLPRLNRINRWLHRYIIDWHIAISKTVQAQCEAEGLSNNSQIYNGIQMNEFTAINDGRNLKVFSAENPIQIINVARLEYEQKGQDILIRALKICKDDGLHFKCRLVGGVYDYNRKSYEYLQELVIDHGLENHVEFVVNRSDVPAFLKQADLFTLPSRLEGFGIAALEAMAAGVPVIVSNIEGPQELVQDKVNGYLFESENFYALAETIKHAYHSPEELKRLKDAAAHFVQQFDISVMAEQYKKLYQSLVFKDLKIKTTEFGRVRNETSF